MKKKMAALVFVCTCLLCVPSSASEISSVQMTNTVERFALTIPEEWIQRDAGMLLSPPSGYDDPGFVISVIPGTEQPGQ